MEAADPICETEKLGEKPPASTSKKIGHAKNQRRRHDGSDISLERMMKASFMVL